MAVTQYIGARYVPLFADPIDWDSTKHYEPLTIVYHQGNSFTSKQFVPTGIDIANTDYWALTGNYNAQVEQYRREVRAFDGRITANAQAIADEVTARMAEDTTIRGLITDLRANLEDEVSARETADKQIRTDFAAADAQIRTDFAAADKQIRTDFTAADKQIRTDFTAADTALSNRVTKLESKKYLVVIGDSFSNDAQTQGPLWYVHYAAEKNLNVYTNASDGMGFVVGGNNNFSAQIDKAYAAHPNDVAEVIIMGGINDFADGSVNSDSFGKAAQSVTAKAIAKWPNAFVTVGILPPFQYAGWTGKNNDNLDRLNEFYAQASWKLSFTRAKTIDMRNLGLFTPGFFGEPNNFGQRHPSNIGSKAIANVFLNGSFLTNIFVNSENCPLRALLNGTGTNCTYSYYMDAGTDGNIQFNFTVNITDTASKASIPFQHFPTPIDNYFPVIDSGGKSKMAYIHNPGYPNAFIDIGAFNATNPCYFNMAFRQR